MFRSTRRSSDFIAARRANLSFFQDTVSFEYRRVEIPHLTNVAIK